MTEQQQYNVEWVDIDSLTMADYNPRAITLEAYEGLLASLRQFGMPQPVVANPDNRVIIGGHQRWKGAKDLGWEKVPVVWKTVANQSEEAALNLTLNNKAIAGTFTDDVSKVLDIVKLEFDPNLFESLRFDTIQLPNVWFDDAGKVDAQEPNLDGITVVIKVECPQELKADVLNTVSKAVAVYEGVSVK